MVGFSVPTWPLLLLFIVSIFYHEADCWCSNSDTSQPLAFEWLQQQANNEYRLVLLEGFRLEMQCCVASKNPSVDWKFNGKPIKEYGDLFELSEKGQVVRSANEALINNTGLEGVYNCTAVQGNETLSASYIIRSIPTSQERCSHGKTTDVKPGYPPNSLFRISSNSSLTLTCTVLLTCHPYYSPDQIYWEKYYINGTANASKANEDDGSDHSRVTAYILFGPEPYDKETGNYVNVTKRRLGTNYWLVTTTLYITNIIDNDLHDPYNPDGYAYLSCYDNDTACMLNRTRNYYECGYSGSRTVNTLQKALDMKRSVTLFRGAPPTSPPPPMTMPPEDNRIEKDGVIIGSTIGAAFILVTVFALLFVAYEWHLKLYIRRVLLQLRSKNGSKATKYEYNCYVACCIKDEKFVYEVLRRQMEEQHGYRLCLPERDFSIGTAIPDEIERCIRSSEYFMAVISPDFWETAWCKLSVDLALRTNAKVVAVIAKELAKEQRDQGNKLMTALKSPGCTSIHSSLLTRESSWEKLVLRLRYAMPRLDSI